jgi:membrane-associated phospholipid phosphatase
MESAKPSGIVRSALHTTRPEGSVTTTDQAALPHVDAASAHAQGRRRMTRVTSVILIVYLCVVVGIMVIRQVAPTPDLFLIFASVVAVMLGRTRAFLRDWVPFVVIFLAWEAMRGIADDFGAEVHSDSVIALERLISFGTVPPEWLQARLYVPGSVWALDLSMSVVYLGHFLLPLLIAFGLWLRSRRQYYEFVLTLMVMSFAAFFTALFVPVAPPRFAHLYGEGLAVYDIVRETMLRLDFAPITTWAYGNVIGNPVAAFPSLHAAYPFLGYLFLRERWPRLAWLMLAYCGVVWFAITYLGHHYIVDAVGGLLYALAAYHLIRATWWRGIFRRPSFARFRPTS